MFWWGDPRINSILNYLYPTEKKKIKCLNDSIYGDAYYITKTIFYILKYLFVIYLFIYALKIKYLNTNKK